MVLRPHQLKPRRHLLSHGQSCSGMSAGGDGEQQVRVCEVVDNLISHTWIVIRIDGRGFTKFSQAHGFQKPNDMDALLLMNAAAVTVVEDMADIVFAYGVSDAHRWLHTVR